jgi:L-amino acid N-acyltransferase YncA
VAPEVQGRGVGRALLTAIVASAEQGGIWTVQTGIFPENQPSVRLHENCGFRVVGVRERLGRLGGPLARCAADGTAQRSYRLMPPDAT